MSEISIYYNFDYSYPINNKLSRISSISSSPLVINIISDSSILFTLAPDKIFNVKWNQMLKLTVSVTNTSQSVIDSFNLKLNKDENLIYIGGTLVNSDTGVYYPCIDWESTFCITESINPGEVLNINYYLTPKSNSSDKSYTKALFNASNTTNKPYAIKTNNSSIYLSEEKIIITTNNSNNLVFIENRGTINSSSFTYKYMTPDDLIYRGAYLSGNPFTDIQFLKLRDCYIFKIGSLPSSRADSPKILTLIFS
ncbi:hypothetical protein [uncultured Clostridium sp.]|uniref:hypothetical protein n=1 Tax=uncultured Clostridium sp. TaxID=59620 RepID=UPI0025D77A17|nr:hypothetical protein [uncultured Clostridium sp.]